MEDYEEVWHRLDQPPVPHRRGRRWLLIGGLALALILALVLESGSLKSRFSTAYSRLRRSLL